MWVSRYVVPVFWCAMGALSAAAIYLLGCHQPDAARDCGRLPEWIFIISFLAMSAFLPPAMLNMASQDTRKKRMLMLLPSGAVAYVGVQLLWIGLARITGSGLYVPPYLVATLVPMGAVTLLSAAATLLHLIVGCFRPPAR